MKLVSRDWMEKAGEDLAATEKLANDPLVTGVASFHAQQCIEKSFKAVLDEAGLPVPRTHDLVRLHALTENLLAIDCDMKLLVELSALYLGARYPGGPVSFTEFRPSTEDIGRYCKAAAHVYCVVQSWLDSLG